MTNHEMPDSRRQPAPNPVVASDFDLDGAFFFPGPDGVPIPVIGAGDVTRQLPGTPTRLLASVVPILRRQGDVVTAEGTAFAISQCGLYLTARHCVFPGQGYPPDDEYDEAVGEGEHVIYLECEQPDAESYQGNPWGVRWRQGQCV